LKIEWLSQVNLFAFQDISRFSANAVYVCLRNSHTIVAFYCYIPATVQNSSISESMAMQLSIGETRY
jgi:hypothetical protein